MRRSLIPSLVLSLAVALVPAGIAAAAGGAGPGAASVGDGTFTGAPSAPLDTTAAKGSFVFYGSGWGHGLGMSQWGAYGLAKQGWGHKQIVRHFYSGTKITSSYANAPTKLRVGLTQGRKKIHLEAQAGSVTLRIENRHTGTVVGTIPSGKTWTVRLVNGQYRVLDASGKRVGGKDWGGTARNLYATYAGARVRSPEGGATYSHGYLEFNVYACAGNACAMRLILVVPPEQYLLGIGEVPSSWPTEALRAQAVAARSYAFSKVEIAGQHRQPCNCALYDYVADMAYIGYAKESGADGKRWISAVHKTAGQVAVSKGNVVQAFFTASDGGWTENNENVWGGSPLSYLRGVCDPGDFASANPNRVWTVKDSGDYVTTRLSPYTGNIGTVQGFSDFSRGVSGRIITVKVDGGGGSTTITGSELKAGLGLNDDRVWINKDKNVTGTIRGKYDHLMCAPGLPTGKQISVSGGSKQRFETGSIYHNTNTVTVWLKGPVYSEYLGTGGVGGKLGLPASSIVAIGGAGCSSGCNRVTFENGRIYWKSGVGAYGLWGRVLKAYLNKGGATGSLGFPTSRVQVADNHSSSGTFEHGSISCPPPGGSNCTIS
jgi:stage II sporulation protein D